MLTAQERRKALALAAHADRMRRQGTLGKVVTPNNSSSGNHVASTAPENFPPMKDLSLRDLTPQGMRVIYY